MKTKIINILVIFGMCLVVVSAFIVYYQYNFAYARSITKAIYKENHTQLEMLLKRNGNINSKDGFFHWPNFSNVMPLTEACRYEDTRGTKLLLEYGADPNLRMGYSYLESITPLHYAVQSVPDRNFEVIKLLVEYGADINAKSIGNTPLITVVSGDFPSEKVVHYLLEHGADQTIRNREGVTVMDYAVKNNLIDIIELLEAY